MTNLEYYFGDVERISKTISQYMGKIDREITVVMLELRASAPKFRTWTDWRTEAIRVWLGREYEDECEKSHYSD